MIIKIPLARIMQWTVIVILGLTPIFFLPTTQNFYDTNKLLFIAVGALLILTVWAFTLFQHKTPLLVTISSGALGFSALTIASFIGLFAASTNKIEALLSPLGPVTFFALTILLFAGSPVAKSGKVFLTWALYTATDFLGLIALYQLLGMGKLIAPHVSYLADPLWTPTGATATTIALFFITLSLLIPDTLTAVKKRQDPGMIAFLIISCIIIAIGTGTTLFQFIPKMTAGVMPFDVGMVVASQIFKNPTIAAFGVGVENFVTAFTAMRPASLNMTPLATLVFTTNTDFFLHILTIYGLIGLSGALILVGSLLTGHKKGWLFITKCLCIASLLLITPTIALLTVVATVLVLAHDGETHGPKSIVVTSWIRMTLGILLLFTVGASFYFLIRAYSAEVYFFRSLRASQANDGTTTYNQQIRAIDANTFVSRYHITYSQTNLLLANSIMDSLNNPAASTKSAAYTAEDRQLASQLIQQAIREAKTAVSLNRTSVAAWENLGLTYQTIMPVATEAAGWALTAYESSVKLDPSNATLFLNIGSIFVNQQQYDNAITLFERAIQLNPSYANAYYNLANVYRLKGDRVSAESSLTKTMNLVQKESSDYYKVKNELEALRQAQTTTTALPSQATGSSSLTIPL